MKKCKEDALLRFVGELVSPAGGRAKLAILGYHRALSAPDPMLHDEIDAVTLEAHMRLLASEFQVIPLSEACGRLTGGKLPARAVCVTFDDGYANNETVALPLLRRLGISATFFVATGYSNGGIMFNDAVIEAARRATAGTHDLSCLGLGIHELRDIASRRVAVDTIIAKLKYRPVAERKAAAEQLAETLQVALPKNLMLSSTQIRRLHDAGMEIGAHTVNHPILAQLGDDEARAEIFGSKRALEEITGASVTMFAYPNGKPGRDYGPQHVRMVREAGFGAAVSTCGGVAHRGNDLFQLPRFSPWDRNSLRLGVRLLVSCAWPAAA
jgi:peptidoglycan/xylan/chitin deacetylase (PgdA/CDA1 family)